MPLALPAVPSRGDSVCRTQPPPPCGPAPPSLTQKAAGGGWRVQPGLQMWAVSDPRPLIHVGGEQPPLESALLAGGGAGRVKKGAASLWSGRGPTRGQTGHPCGFSSPWASYKVTVKSSRSSQEALGQGCPSCEATDSSLLSVPQFPHLSTRAFQNRHLPRLGTRNIELPGVVPFCIEEGISLGSGFHSWPFNQ